MRLFKFSCLDFTHKCKEKDEISKRRHSYDFLFLNDELLKSLRIVCVRKTNNNLRSTNMLYLPRVGSTKRGLRSFRFFAAKTWNTLPETIRAVAGTNDFLRKIHRVRFLI